MTLVLSAIAFCALSASLGLYADKAYGLTFFGLGILDAAALFLLVVGEAFALTFDRTASANTLVATLGIFSSYLFSTGFARPLSYFGVEISGVGKTVSFCLFEVSLLLASIFVARFFSRDYGLGGLKKVHVLSLSLLAVLGVAFASAGVGVGALISAAIESAYLVFMGVYYFLGVRKKDNPLPGLLASLILCYLALALLSEGLCLNGACPIDGGGAATLLYLAILLNYVFIYVDFLIDKTRKTYRLEEEQTRRETLLSHKMEVSCFHAFDCRFKGEQLRFPSKKSKELFALLVILSGKPLSMEKAVTYLWPDKDVDLAKGSYRNAVMKLRKYFAEIGYTGMSFHRAETALDAGSLKCDYYQVAAGLAPYDGSPLLPEFDWSFEFENALGKY